MKTFRLFAAAGVSLLAFAAHAIAAVPPVHVQIYDADGNVRSGYATKADSSGITLSPYETGQGAALVPKAGISKVEFQNPPDYEEALAAYTSGDFAKAEELFGKVVKDYEFMAPWEDGFAALSNYYLLESLRLQGKYQEVATAVDRMQNASRDVNRRVALSSRFKAQLELYNAWGHVGKGYWKALAKLVENYETDAAGNEIKPTQKPVKKMRPREVVQIHYLRGVAAENLDQKQNALNDYYRCFTLDNGAETRLSNDAMLGALRILKDWEDAEENYQILKERHALAVIYKTTFGGGEIPAEFSDFLTPPPAPPEEGEEAAAAPPEAKPKAGEAKEGEAKADDKKEGEKAE